MESFDVNGIAYGDLDWNPGQLLEFRDHDDHGRWYVAGTGVPISAVTELVVLQKVARDRGLPVPEASRLGLTEEQCWAALFKARDLTVRALRFIRPAIPAQIR